MNSGLVRSDMRGMIRVNQSAVSSSGEKLVGAKYSEQIQVKQAYHSVEERGAVE